MSNGPIPPEASLKPNSSGIGGLLTTIASKGGDKVQILIVLGVIVNTAMTQCNGKGISKGNRNLDRLRASMAQQLRSVYNNQSFLFDFVDEVRASQDRIQTKLGIEHPKVAPYPRTLSPDIPDYLRDYINPDQTDNDH